MKIRPANLYRTLLIATAISVLGTLSACTADPASHSATPTTSPEKIAKIDNPIIELSAEEISAFDIKRITLQTQTVPEHILMTATIEANPNKLAQITPRVVGKVSRVNAQLGAQVKAGQALAWIDSIEVGEAQSNHAQAQTELRLAQAGFNRAKQLAAENIIPQKNFLQAQADLEKSQAVANAAQTRLKTLNVGQGSGSLYPLNAPFNGEIIEQHAVLGETAQIDMPLFTVADLSTLWINVNVFEKDIGKVKKGAAASITTNAYPDQIFNGKVTYVGSVINKETRTAQAIIEVNNPNKNLNINMFANVGIELSATTKQLLIPNVAVILIQGQPHVFVANANGYIARAVALGEPFQQNVPVMSGVQIDEQIVTQGAYALKAKMLKSQISTSF